MKSAGFAVGLIVLTSLILVAPFGQAQTDGPSETLNLVDGSVIVGAISSKTASEVVVVTSYGVSRIPTGKLTEESRKRLGVEVDVAAMQKRIADLEKENADLRAKLARMSALPPAGASAVPLPPQTSRMLGEYPGGSAATSQAAPRESDSGLRWSKSSTGKRHNSRCRYYGSGKPCGPTDGVACKICGG